MWLEMQIKNNFFLPEGKIKLRFFFLIKRPFRIERDYSSYTFICTNFIFAMISITRVIILICINAYSKSWEWKKETATRV